jgi:hypothetical protein
MAGFVSMQGFGALPRSFRRAAVFPPVRTVSYDKPRIFDIVAQNPVKNKREICL